MFHHFTNVYNVDWHCVKIWKQSQHSSPPNPFLLCLANQILKSNKRQHIAFELWCWRRLLRVPWTVRRSNKSILKEINPEYSLEGLMLNLKLQYFGHLMQRANFLQMTLILGKIEGRRKRGWQRTRWLYGINDSMDMSFAPLGDGEGQGSLVCCSHSFQKTHQINLFWSFLKSAEELMLLNCGVGEDSSESLGLQGDPTSPFWRRSALGFLWKEWC